MNFEWLDLKAFLSVTAHGSFQKAAEELHMSQPTLSRRVRKLEDRLGAALFERTTRFVGLTPAGRNLHPVAVRLVDEFEDSVLSLDVGGARQVSHITVACIPTATIYFLPNVIRKFNRQYPNTRFRIYDLSASDVFESVSDGHSDLGINVGGFRDRRLKFTHIMDDPYVLACRAEDKFAKCVEVTWVELEGVPLISVNRAIISRIILDEALSAEGIELNSFYEVNRPATSLGLVEAGLAVSIIPRVATPIDLECNSDLRIIPIVDPVVTRPIGIVESKSRKLSPQATYFRDLLLSK